MTPPIPVLESLPVPAPVWLLYVLLTVTFIAHILFVNCLLGGTVLAAFCHLKGKNDKNHLHLSKTLFSHMPVITAFTVNAGVAPLLFVQALYGHLFFTSSILTAYAWFAVIPLLIIGYYCIYLLRFKWDTLEGMRFPLTVVTVVVCAVVAFIYVSNFTLMLRPETWNEHYFQNPATGKFNWSDPQIYPRYLHILLGAAAVTGVWIMLIGSRKRSGDPEWSQWAVQFGSKMFFYPTLLNAAAGCWFLFVQPRRIMMIFLGENTLATILLALSVLLTITALIILFKAGRAENSRKLINIGAGSAVILIAMMSIMRSQLRNAYLEPYFKPEQLTTEPQWAIIILFAVIFVIGLAVLGWMIHAVARSRPETAK